MDAKQQIAKAYDLITKTSNSQYVGFDGVFKAHASIDETIKGKATLSKYYLEDSSVVTDHIILDPKVLTVSGEVANVVFQRNALLDSYIKARSKLGAIGVYISPKTVSQVSQVSKYVNTATNTFRKLEDVGNKLSSTSSYLSNVTSAEIFDNVDSYINGSDSSLNKNNQSDFINFIQDYFNNKKTMKIDTAKFGTLQNMAITNFSINTKEKSFISYTIDFQEVRTATTIETPIQAVAKKVTGDQVKAQTSEKKDKGVVQGKEKTLLQKAISLF